MWGGEAKPTHVITLARMNNGYWGHKRVVNDGALLVNNNVEISFFFRNIHIATTSAVELVIQKRYILVYSKILHHCDSEESLSELSADAGIQALPALRFYKGGKEVMEPVIDYKQKLILTAVEKLQKA